MIASQKIGKSFAGALRYHLKKLQYPDGQQAELLESNFASCEQGDILREVAWLRQLRPKLNRYVYHTSLNFSPAEADKLDNNKMLSIAKDYLEKMGFNDNQYLIFRHHDAHHPHIHLLVNRIRFDGQVVSDSNNYQRSEQALREIERRYGLDPVLPRRQAIQRAAKKDELEMVLRTGKPSQKMLLQEVLKTILQQRNQTLDGLIQAGEKAGIHFLFNQSANGRVSGITYFKEDFKIKGQALGKAFKWTTLVKQLNDEQDRDRAAIGEANRRTRALYGAISKPYNDGQEPTSRARDAEPVSGNRQDTGNGDGYASPIEPAAEAAGRNRGGTWQAATDAGMQHGDTAGDFDYPIAFPTIEIGDDVDDEAVYGRQRRRRGR